MDIEIFYPKTASLCANIAIPLFISPVSAGFPSPAQDYVEKSLDLNELCITHPAATFFVRVQGDSMINGGIHSGDVLIVDRALTANHHDIVVASLDGEFTVKRLCLKPIVQLEAMNPNYPSVIINNDTELQIFGVVTYVIHQTR